MDALLSAAAAGDAGRLRRSLARGVPIDRSDPRGDTALHRAFYAGRLEAVANLRAFGADENLRNKEGLTPPEMARVAEAEELLREGVRCLAADGAWRAEERARPLYDRLVRQPPRILNPALARLARRDGECRALPILAIKVGARGSESGLVAMLDGFGDRSMAVAYLNSGSPVLREAAERWAGRNGYRVYHRAGRAGVLWGRF
ncbi:hypothetical protein GCM10010191_65340 [Actinomadura vinacea]|uniref:Ankyrin repeat domain-containing protein n=1 Tax=Actinomadura vinacea TaxID=115336 RepID=A0ABN3JWW2_9ACTN